MTLIQLPSHRGRRLVDQGPAEVEPRFFTLEETAHYLNVSKPQVYALVRSGELPAIKIGGAGCGGSTAVSSTNMSSAYSMKRANGPKRTLCHQVVVGRTKRSSGEMMSKVLSRPRRARASFEVGKTVPAQLRVLRVRLLGSWRLRPGRSLLSCSPYLIDQPEARIPS